MARRSKALSVQPKKPAPSKIGIDFYNDPKPKMIPQSYVFCTLNPETEEVFVELHDPSQGIRHTVKCESIDTIKRVLLWRKDLIRTGSDMVMGEDGNPTEAQIQHWENHSKRTQSTKLNSTCPFCIAEARAESNAPKARKFDTRGNLIQIVNSASEMGFKKVSKPAPAGESK